MNALTEAASGLADLLEGENEALRRFDLQGAMEWATSKRAQLAALQDAGSAAALETAADPQLRALATRLHDAASENKLLLERAMRAQHHVMSLLARAARRTGAATRYGSQGAFVGHGADRAFALSARA